MKHAVHVTTLHMAVWQILEGGTMYYGVDLIQNRSTQIQFNLNFKAIIAFKENDWDQITFCFYLYERVRVMVFNATFNNIFVIWQLLVLQICFHFISLERINLNYYSQYNKFLVLNPRSFKWAKYKLHFNSFMIILI